MPGCRVAVVPHHTLAAPFIAAGIDALLRGDDGRPDGDDGAAVGNGGGAVGSGPGDPPAGAAPGPPPSAPVVLIGVDHGRSAAATAATSARDWQLPDGRVTADAAAVADLIATRAAVEAGPLLAVEHSVAGLVPFVAAAAPGAAIVPLAVRPNGDAAAIAALADAIARRLGDGGRVVAAVDFAHGLSPGATAAHGRAAAAALSARDAAAVGRWDDTFADGRGALQLAMALAERLGATAWTTLAVADSTALPAWTDGGVTGYIVGCWAVGGEAYDPAMAQPRTGDG